MLWAMSFRIVVLPALGGETIKPRCPNPTGEIKSMMRVVILLLVVSSLIFSSG